MTLKYYNQSTVHLRYFNSESEISDQRASSEKFTTLRVQSGASATPDHPGVLHPEDVPGPESHSTLLRHLPL